VTDRTTTDPSTGRTHASRVLVLGTCSHWWIEYRPNVLRVEPTKPRVCTQCPPGSYPAAAVGLSPQGLPMVPVVYIDQWTEEQQ
jgi:hypothetical protein